MRFYVSQHCKKRYFERVLANSNSCNNLLFQILNDLNSAKNITSFLADNYPRFVLYVKERYGKDIGFNFLKKDHTIFVATKRKGTIDLYDVLTCYIEDKTLEKFANTALSKEEIYFKLSTLKK